MVMLSKKSYFTVIFSRNIPHDFEKRGNFSFRRIHCADVILLRVSGRRDFLAEAQPLDRRYRTSRVRAGQLGRAADLAGTVHGADRFRVG